MRRPISDSVFKAKARMCEKCGWIDYAVVCDMCPACRNDTWDPVVNVTVKWTEAGGE
jgi:hypothetical protein